MPALSGAKRTAIGTNTRTTAKKAKQEEVEDDDTPAQDASKPDDESKLSGGWWINSVANCVFKLGYDEPDALVHDGFSHSHIASFDRMKKNNGEYVMTSGFMKVYLKYDDHLPDQPTKEFTLLVDNFKQKKCDGVIRHHANLTRRKIGAFVNLFERTLRDDDDDDDDDDGPADCHDEETSNKLQVKLKKPKSKEKAKPPHANVNIDESEIPCTNIVPSEFVVPVSKFDTNFVHKDPGVIAEAGGQKRNKKVKPVSEHQQFREEMETHDKEFNKKTAIHYRGLYHVFVNNLKPAIPLYLDKVTTEEGVRRLKKGIRENTHRLRLMPAMVCLYDGSAHKFLSEQKEMVAKTDEQYPPDGPEAPVNVQQTAGDLGDLMVLGGNHRRQAFIEIIQEELASGSTYKQITADFDIALVRVPCTVYSMTVKDVVTKVKSKLENADIKRLAAEDNKMPACFQKTWFDSGKNFKRSLLAACGMNASDLHLTIPKKKRTKNMDKIYKQLCWSECPEAKDKKQRATFDKAKLLATLDGASFQLLLDIEKICNDVVIEESKKRELRAAKSGIDVPSKTIEFITLHYVGVPVFKLPDEMHRQVIAQLKEGVMNYLQTCKENEVVASVRGLRVVFAGFAAYCEKEAVHHDFRMAFGAYVGLESFADVRERFPEQTNPDTYRVLLESDVMGNKNAKYIKIKNIPTSWKNYFKRAVDWYEKEKARNKPQSDGETDGCSQDTESDNKLAILREHVCGSVIALRKLDFSLASHLRTDDLEFEGISTFLVMDLSTQENGQTVINNMAKMSKRLETFVIICLNDTPSKLDEVFDLKSFRKQLLYIDITDLRQFISEVTGICDNVKFVTLLIGGSNRTSNRKTGKPCVIQAKSLTDPQLMRDLVKTVTPKDKWILDSVSGRTSDPLLLAKVLLHSYAETNFHMFLDVTFIPNYVEKCDGWYETLAHQNRTINIASEKEIKKRSLAATANHKDWLTVAIEKAFPIKNPEEAKDFEDDEIGDDDGKSINESEPNESSMNKSGSSHSSPNSQKDPEENSPASLFCRSDSDGKKDKTNSPSQSVPNGVVSQKVEEYQSGSPTPKPIVSESKSPSQKVEPRRVDSEANSAGPTISTQTPVASQSEMNSGLSQKVVLQNDGTQEINGPNVTTTPIPVVTPTNSVSKMNSGLSQKVVQDGEGDGTVHINGPTLKSTPIPVAPTPVASEAKSNSGLSQKVVQGGDCIEEINGPTVKSTPTPVASEAKTNSGLSQKVVQGGEGDGTVAVEINGPTVTSTPIPVAPTPNASVSKTNSDLSQCIEEINGPTVKSTPTPVATEAKIDSESSKEVNIADMPSPIRPCIELSKENATESSIKRKADIETAEPPPDAKQIRLLGTSTNTEQPLSSKQQDQVQVIFPPFSPTNKDWQLKVCNKFKWQRIKSPKYHHSEQTSIHNVIPSKSVPIEGDGNCLFRSLAVAVAGTEELHKSMRLAICKHMRNNAAEYTDYVGYDVNKYLEKEEMDQVGTWGTDIEIQVAANILETDIYTFMAGGEGNKMWARFYARKKNWIRIYDHPGDNYQAIYLTHSGDHYDLVRTTKINTKLENLEVSSDKECQSSVYLAKENRETNNQSKVDTGTGVYQSDIEKSYVKLPRREKSDVERYIIKQLPTDKRQIVSLRREFTKSPKNNVATTSNAMKTRSGGDRNSVVYRRCVRRLKYPEEEVQKWKNHKFPNDTLEY